MQINAYQIQYKMDNFAIVRPSNIYGPGDNFDEQNAMVIPSLIARVHRGDNPVKIWGDGSSERDFLHATDAALGIIFACINGTGGKPINLGCGYGISIKNLVETLQEVTSFKTFFEASRDEDWFNNTIFIITADHGSQPGFAEYRKTVNRTATPILIYKPDNSLTEVKKELAQQIDIYPTIIDLIGYDQPFRSWGRSLINDSLINPFTINYCGSGYVLQRDNYICFFDGEKATGFYDINDKDLKINLIEQSNSQMDTLEIVIKAFVKDFYDRIVDKNLGKPKK